MAINIQLNNVQIQVGHGQYPDGQKAASLLFLDPQSGISVEVTLVGDGIENFAKQLKGSPIEIASIVPK